MMCCGEPAYIVVHLSSHCLRSTRLNYRQLIEPQHAVVINIYYKSRIEGIGIDYCEIRTNTTVSAYYLLPRYCNSSTMFAEVRIRWSQENTNKYNNFIVSSTILYEWINYPGLTAFI